jgi:hypothetical protein
MGGIFFPWNSRVTTQIFLKKYLDLRRKPWRKPLGDSQVTQEETSGDSQATTMNPQGDPQGDPQVAL